MNKVDKEVKNWKEAVISEHMSSIGSKGGKAGKGSKARREANRRTALARFRKLHPPAPEIKQDAYEPPDGQDYRDQE